MPLYRYTAFNRRGKEEKGIVNAPDPRAARLALRKKGLYVRTVSEDTEKKERELFPALTKLLYRIPRRDVGIFARQLGTLLDAGIPLDRSLDTILEQTENPYLKKALMEIRTAVVEGSSLSEAIKKHPSVFPPLYHHLISVGETTGTYEQSLLRLADLEEANQILRSKVMTATFYPVVMILLLGGIMVFLMAVVLPQMEQLFIQMNAKLPLITRIIIGISSVVGSWKIIFPASLLAIGVYLFQNWKSEPAGREKYERFLLGLPYLGRLIRKVVLVRFARNLGVMLRSRVPLITALQVVSRLTENLLFEKEILQAIDRIKEGSRMTEAFRDSVVLDGMTMGMLSAGESSDTIPEMVSKIADILEQDVNAAIQRLSTLLEPVLMIVMGFLIAVVMSAILLPMYDLTNQIR